MSILEKRLQTAGEKAKQFEVTSRRRMVISLLIPAIAASFVLLVSGIQIRQAKKEAERYKETANQLQVRIQELSKAEQLVITRPSDAELVGFTELVKGQTPFSGMNHYILITSIETGQIFVEGPVSINPDGSWIAPVYFGESHTGIGKRFLLRALATKSSLQPGLIGKIPEDAKLSEPVIVVRRN